MTLEEARGLTRWWLGAKLAGMVLTELPLILMDLVLVLRGNASFAFATGQQGDTVVLVGFLCKVFASVVHGIQVGYILRDLVEEM